MRARADRPVRGPNPAAGRAFRVGVSLFLGLGLAAAARAQAPAPVAPRLFGDPTGRSSEPPPLFGEQPRPIPAPGQLLPPLQPTPPSEPETLPRIQVFVREIHVVGSTVLAPEEVAAVTEKYTGREVSAEDLEALRVALTQLYIQRGYVNSGAILPDQTVKDGVITYQIIEGSLTRTEVQGNRWLRARWYQDRLALSSGPPLNVDRLQERLQLLLEDPRIERLNAELKPDVGPAQAILDLQVEERFPLKLFINFDNYQAPSVGAERGIATFVHQSLTGRGDIFALSYGRSQGLDPLLDVSYAIPLTARDTTLALQYRRNDLTVIQEPFDVLDIQSDSEIYTLALRQPVYRTPSTLAALELIGERQAVDTSVLGIPFSLEPGAVDGQAVVTALRFAQELVYRTRSQVFAVRSRFSFGLDALGSTIHDNGQPDSQFFAWLGQFQWVRQFKPVPRIGLPDTQLIVRSDVQLANQPLMTVEQFALGGRYTVRGYPQNTLVRDNGFVASVEGRIPIVRGKRWADYLELAPFIDYGQGWNTDRPTGNPPDLSGVGVGLRWGMTVPARVPLRSQLEFYWGYPLRQVRTTATAIEGDGLYFQLLFGIF